jgi:hypothetical protein
MKQTILLLCFLSLSLGLRAQNFYTDVDSLDINNLKAYLSLHGDFWGQTDTAAWSIAMQTRYPRNSKKHITDFAGLWIAGYDQNHQLHASATLARWLGADFWPGPLDSAGNTNAATIDKWARTWKVSQAQVDTFLSIGTHTLANTPQSILEWPAKDNPYAKGRNGAPLTINRAMAPFVDADNNGSYDPLVGDYPLIKGDVMTWWLINDNGPAHTMSNGTALKVEVQNAAYAFSRGTEIDNTVFQEFHVVNRSANSYDSVRMAVCISHALGYSFDDYIGFDSAYRMAYVYNGNTLDGWLADSFYYDHVPVAGICMLQQPGDSLPLKQPAGACVYFNWDNSDYGTPRADTEFYNYMHARGRTNGAHFTNDYTGPGHPSSATQPGPNTNYVYSGDPADSAQWSECSAGNPVGNRKQILSTGDFTLAAGGSAILSLALVVSDTTSGNACPTVDIHTLETVADSAQYAYRSALGIAKVSGPDDGVKVYPNPAKNKVHIEALAKIKGLEVTDLMGRQLNVHYVQKDKSCELDVAVLPAGMYILKLQVGSGLVVTRLVKE